MASKKVHVRAHDRTIHTRVFVFICPRCDKKVEVETYSTICPTYCAECKRGVPKKYRHRTKK